MTMPIPDGSVIITPTQMYTEIQAANAKIDHLTAILDPAVRDMQSDISDHETRIRTLEATGHQSTSRDKVIYAIAGFVGSGLIALIAAWITTH